MICTVACAKPTMQGVIHGNIKPSNILIQWKEDGSFDGWLTEFALSKISGFQAHGQGSGAKEVFVSQSLQFQESLKETQKYRPKVGKQPEFQEEMGDIYALGGIVQSVLAEVHSFGGDWSEWELWSQQAMNGSFSHIALSMEALPGVSDLSEYGIKSEKSHKDADLSDYEIRKKREIEWERKQKVIFCYLQEKYNRTDRGFVLIDLCVFQDLLVL